MRFSLPLLCLAVCGGLQAQSFSASIVGNVTDASGATIPNAAISATNAATNAQHKGISDESGKYTITGLQPGLYTLDSSASGFKRFVRSGIELAVQQQARVDIALAVGEVSESITVSGEVSTIETTSSALGKVVSNKAILNLPLNTRNVFSLIYLTPGVAGTIGNNYNSMSYSVNGSRTSVMEILIDGATATHPTVQGYTGISAFPSVDAIGEFKMLGSSFSAEYGRSQGSVLNVIYKSGTNQFHGSAYEFLRNSVLDANNFFSNSRGVELGSFKRSQYGATLGGPIKRDRTFFMTSYEGLRQRSALEKTTTVPTERERNGDFSQTFAPSRNLVQIFDPFTTRPNPAGGFIRDPFPGNIIPQDRINPVSRNILKYMPLSNTPGAAFTNANNWYRQGSSVLDIDQIDGRLDHSFTDMQRIFVRVSKRNQDDNPPVLWPAEIAMAEDRINQSNRMYNGVLDYTNARSATTIINSRIAFARSLYVYANQGLDFSASSLGFPAALDTAGGLPMFPRTSTAGYATLGNTDHRHNAFMTYTASAAVTKIAGAHTWKAGYEGRMIRVNNRESRSTSGDFTFTAGFTQGPNPNQAAADRGNGLASLLLGTGSGTLIQSFKDAAAQSFYTAFYLQDDWRVTNKLTLNLGVRYDLDSPRTERFDRMNYFDPNVTSPLASQVPGYSNLRGGLVFVGVDGRPRTQYNIDNNNVAPRLGFAYQLNEKTTIRAGWGNFFGISPQQAHGTVGPFGYRTQTPWIGSIDGITPNDLISNPFPRGFTATPGSSQGLLTQAGANIQAPLQDTVTPYSMQWNFNIQRELPGQVLLEAAYVGTRGYQLSRNDESGLSLNQLDPQYMSLGSRLNETVDNPFFGKVDSGVLATSRVSRAQLLRPYPQFTDIIPLYSSGSSSSYHALQISFSKRFSHGLQFEGSYTSGKAIDNGMSHANSYDIRASKSLATFDISQRFVASYIYELPFGRGRRLGANWSTPLNLILGGWQFNGITTYQSGTPLSITANNVSGIFNSRGLASNNGKSGKLSGDVHERLDRYFDTSVFSQPAPFTLGNTSPQVADIRSHGMRNWDLSMFKEFSIREGWTLQFRSEFLNAFNTVRFSTPNTNVASNQFGLINSQANSPRQIQFGLKLLW
jgi:hypothetical protein